MEIVIGDKFGMLTVIGIERDSKNYTKYIVQCSCDNQTICYKTKQSLLKGTDNCGCYSAKKQSDTKKIKNMNLYDLSGEYGVGYVPSGEEFYFDLEDYNLIKDYRWNIGDKRQVPKYIRAIHRMEHKMIRLHRLIMSAQEDEVVDHINHNTFDNRKENLRIVTHQQNSFNKQNQKRKQLRRGIYLTPSGNYISRIIFNGKKINLGTYKTIEEATCAREKAEIQYYGEYRYKEE